MSSSSQIRSARRSVAAAVITVAAACLLTFIMPDFSGEVSMGIFSVIPALFLICYIFFTKRMFEGLILASLIGYVMLDRSNFGMNFSDGLLKVMMSGDIAWLFLVCGLMGSIIALVEKAGGAYAFGEWVAKKAKTRESVLMWTWILGIVIFLDDYLNALVIGSCMSPLCDKHRSSREFLAFIVDYTAAPAAS